MKSILFLLVCFSSALTASAQEFTLSLAQAIELGLKNKIALKNQQLAVSLAENEEAKTRTKNLPQVSATLDARVNTQLQTQVISPQATGGSPSPDPIRAKFGTKYFNVLGLNLNQNIFNPSIRYDRLINKERTELERLNLEKSESDAILSISEAYLDAAFKKVKWETSQYNVQVEHDQFLRVMTQYNSGTKLKIDLDKARLDERNAMQSGRTDSSQYLLALRYLANEMSLPDGATLKLTELEDKDGDLTQPVDEATPAHRVEVRTEMQQLSIYQLNRSRQKASYLPSLSLYGNYTVQQFNKSFDPTDGKFWTPYNYVGLRMEIPVFDGLLKERNKKEYDFRIEQSHNTVAQLNQQIRYEVESARAAYDEAKTNFSIARETYAMAKEILSADLVRLQSGSILPVEARNSQYAMLTAQTNYLNGLYQFLLSRIRLQKAMGVLK